MTVENSSTPYVDPYDMPQGQEFDLPQRIQGGGEPSIIELEDGGVEITLNDDESSETDLSTLPHNTNLAEHLSEKTLTMLSTDLVQLVEDDVRSRKDWSETFVKGMEVLGLKYEERTDPWPDACGVYSTVLAEAAIRFQAEAMSETFPSMGPVKTKILGEVTRDKEDAAERVRADMNYELTEVMTEYRAEHERLLYSLGLAGSAFKKVYFDPILGRQTAVFLPAEDVVVPYGASTIEGAERVTHIMRKTENEVKALQRSGVYVEGDLVSGISTHTDIEKMKAEETGYDLSTDTRHLLYEIHAEVEIEEDCGCEDTFPKPYIVTLDTGTNKVLGVYRNWPEEPKVVGVVLQLKATVKKKNNFFVHYTYVPGFGFYGLGLIHIIGGYARAGTLLIRQLVDAGTLSNLPGGLKTRGLRVKGDDIPISPGEFRDVDVPSGTIRDNVMTLPYKEPSQTLLALLNIITEEGRRLGAIADMSVSDMSANAPVGTTLALLERTLKPMAAIQSRVHFAMKQEFKLLKAIISQNAPQEYGYVPERGEPRAKQADYATVDVIPVSDPNSSTMAQRVVQYQAVQQLSSSAPQIYDMAYLHREMIQVLGIKNADKIIPITDEILPSDPVSENMSLLNGKPIKAFMEQDSDAHIATHTAFIQDPKIQAFMGQTPNGQMINTAMMAHIAEHMAFSYRKQIEDQLGAPLPPPGQPIPPDIEVELSRLVADAGKQLTGQHQQEAAQEQAEQQAQDPMFQLQQAEVAVKKSEVDRKSKRDDSEMEIARRELKLKESQAALGGHKEIAKHSETLRKTKVDERLRAIDLKAKLMPRGPNERKL